MTARAPCVLCGSSPATDTLAGLPICDGCALILEGLEVEA